jgi:hypothetical protein
MKIPDINDKKAYWEWVKVNSEEDRYEGWESDYYRAVRMLEELEEKIKITLEACEAFNSLGKPKKKCCWPNHIYENDAHTMIHAIEHICLCLNDLTFEEQKELFKQEEGLEEFLSQFTFLKPFLKTGN